MTDPLRLFAVDDEELALKRIRLLVDRIADAEVIGCARGAEEARMKVPALRPDVMLVDVKMAGADGFELVESLPPLEQTPLIIFVTAFDQYAARAFDVSAIDFLVKPIELSRLVLALGKARRSLAASDSDLRIAELRQVVAALREETRLREVRRFETEIWAERQGDFHPVRVSSIDWVEADRDYVHLHTAAGSFLLRETVSNMTDRLDPAQFIRVRRSALVRRDRVRTIRRAGYGDIRLQLATGAELRVGTTYVKQIRAMIASRRRKEFSA